MSCRLLNITGKRLMYNTEAEDEGVFVTVSRKASAARLPRQGGGGDAVAGGGGFPRLQHRRRRNRDPGAAVGSVQWI